MLGEVALEIKEVLAKGMRAPSLKIVLVGDNAASSSYVRAKQRALGRIGMTSEVVKLGDDVTQAELLDNIDSLNADFATDGMIVQLPLPSHLDSAAVLKRLAPHKDVDGLHPLNAGNLVASQPGFIPATPLGVVELLRRSNIATRGKRAVVLGRSRLVGMPLAILLAGRRCDATTTVLHHHSKDPEQYTRQADILVSAVGKPNLVLGDMVKPGATVIDVGTNRVKDDSERGYRLTGDVDFDAVAQVAGAVTPVPGGVGPMTVAMLISNVLRAYRIGHQAQSVTI